MSFIIAKYVLLLAHGALNTPIFIFIDRDECSRGEDNCTAELNEVCMNTMEGFECVCQMGYYRSNNTSICVGKFQYI